MFRHGLKKNSKTEQHRRAVAGAVAAILSGAAMLAAMPARAHTDSLGFIITDGSGDGLYNAEIFYGSWHGGSIAAEGQLALYFNGDLIATETFVLVDGYTNVANGTVPTGLVAGTNYFFANTMTPETGDLTGDPAGHYIFNFQSVTFFDLTPGLYTFGYATESGLSVNWSTSDPAINNGSFTITADGGLGGVGGAEPSSNDIDTSADGGYDASNLGDTLNPVFTGGTLNLDQDGQDFGQTFSLDDSGTSAVDMNGNANTISGTFEDSSGAAGRIIFTDSGEGGSVVLSGANTHTGGTTVAGGTVILEDAGTLGAITGATTVTGGTLDLGGTTQVQATLAQSGGVVGGGAFDVGTYQITGGTLAADTTINASTLFDVQSGVLNGRFAGTGALQKSGSGAVTLAAGNTYAGGTSIAAGTLVGSSTSFGAGAIDNEGALVIDENADVDFANAILGSGSVTKTGTGSVVLTGTNSYSGTTVISAGGLAGGAGSFGSGAIVADGTLTLDQGSDATFANVLGGSGSFVKTGAGYVNLTGANTFSGATTVAAGRLAVNGSLGASQVTVQDGATLGGIGTVGGVVAASGGIVAPGNSIGTLAITGDYTPAAGSIYEVELDSTGASDRIEASGQAVIADGALLQVVKMDSLTPYVLGTRYGVLTADGGVSGTFTLTGDTQVSAFYSVVAAYDANNVFLDVAQTTSFAALGQTPNQRAAAAGLNSLAVGTPLYDAIGHLQTAGEARAAFDQLSGEIHASLKSTVFGSSRLVRTAASGRARTAMDGIAGADGAALSQNPECPAAAGSAECPVVWMQAIGSWGSIDFDGNAAELESSAGGLLIGTDARIGDWRLGALAGYSHDSFDVEARRSSGTNTAYHLGAYGSRQWGQLGLRVGATYAWNDIETERQAAFTGFAASLAADYDIDSMQAFAELGYRINRGRFAVEPFAALAYANLDAGAFTEDGGSAALSSVAGSMDTTTSTLGVRLANSFAVAGVEALTRFEAAWQHGFGNQTPVSTLGFAGGSRFQVAGVATAEDAAVLEAGMDFRLARRGTLSLAYTGLVASDAEDHGVKASLNVAF